MKNKPKNKQPKNKLKETLKKENNFISTIEKWEKEKATAIKKLEANAKALNPNANKRKLQK